LFSALSKLSMKAPVILSALAAITVGSSAVLATPVGGNEARSPSPITVKLERRAKNAKPEDINLKAWIDRGQDVQVSLLPPMPKCPVSD
jgi:hypothetical protein